MTFWPTLTSDFYRIVNYCDLSEIVSKGQRFLQIKAWVTFFVVHSYKIWNHTWYQKFNISYAYLMLILCLSYAYLMLILCLSYAYLMLSYVMPNVLAPLKKLQLFDYFQNMTFWLTFNWGFYRIENYCNLSEIVSKGYSLGNILLQLIPIHYEIIHDTENTTYEQIYAELYYCQMSWCYWNSYNFLTIKNDILTDI